MRIETQAIAAAGEVELMIRPERLRPSAEGNGADNTFDMTVDDVINYGDSLLVIGKTHGVPLRARMVGGADKLQAGAALKLAWSPADAHVLPRPPAGRAGPLVS
jgi:putative spermidine/putrescine transport system ATP-binding protein